MARALVDLLRAAAASPAAATASFASQAFARPVASGFGAGPDFAAPATAAQLEAARRKGDEAADRAERGEGDKSGAVRESDPLCCKFDKKKRLQWAHSYALITRPVTAGFYSQRFRLARTPPPR